LSSAPENHQMKVRCAHNEKVLLLGASGYVGSAFLRLLKLERIEVVTLSRSDVNYYEAAALTELIRQIRPTFLINAAGYTGKPNVDACEVHRSDCLLGNAALPGVIRQACESTDLPWGHVSSGCIYQGTHSDGSGFSEQDPANFDFRHNNCSFYSGCKALGEELLEGAQQVYLWRLRIPFSHLDSPRNYLSKLLRYERLLEARNSVSNLEEFVSACWACWSQRIPYGKYNVTNPGSITTGQIVQLIQQHLCPEKRFQFFSDEADFMTKAAKTPRSNCVLDTSKLEAAGIYMPAVQDSIIASLKAWTWADSI
jgi:UDP-glucose 4,6-dehydratase